LSPRRREKIFSVGDINEVIDQIFHRRVGDPKIDGLLVFMDGVAHFINEAVVHGGAPEDSIKKFIKYNSPKLLKELNRAIVK